MHLSVYDSTSVHIGLLSSCELFQLEPCLPVFLSCQLTENWGDRLFSALKQAGGRAYSNMAVGFNNVDVDAATRHGIAVGNTPVSSAINLHLNQIVEQLPSDTKGRPDGTSIVIYKCVHVSVPSDKLENPSGLHVPNEYHSPPAFTSSNAVLKK